jgi:hypothetical protein
MRYFYCVVPKARFSPKRLDRYSILPMTMETLTSYLWLGISFETRTGTITTGSRLGRNIGSTIVDAPLIARPVRWPAKGLPFDMRPLRYVLAASEQTSFSAAACAALTGLRIIDSTPATTRSR